MNTASAIFDLPDSAATERLGQALAATRVRPASVHLHGHIGAGKTTLARALLRALGVEGPVRSPTFTLMERYPLRQGEAVHMDLYRLADPGELDFLGLDDLHEEADLWLVEWPERGVGVLPPADLTVAFETRGEGRRAMLQAGPGRGADWLEAIKARFS